ncbi:MAG TPA: hypothetical protein PKJ63_10405 [Cyclobacteriaceae bacterium]|nr:hypothetical protein [Cyclobacteriaceae bacterium]HRW99273.1 hypothetical protein [Cyclobacteriaceae bacterium]
MFLATQLGFALLTVVFFVLVLKELKMALSRSGFEGNRQKKILNRVSLALSFWLALVSVLSIRGFFSNFDSFPPRLMIVLFVPLITLVWALLISKTTKELLPFISPRALTGLQVFRLFVEILLWMLFIQNLIPIQMTFEGRNFDILAGITGPIIAYLAYSKHVIGKTGVIIWNVACLCLLINIVATAILSIPSPFRYFMNEPANTIVTEFPIIWLPAFLVPLAYSLHFLSLRQLINQKN